MDPSRSATHFTPCWDDVIGDRERQLLRGRPHDERLPEPVALLMVDLFAQAFTPAEHPLSCEPQASLALPHIRRLLEAARRAGVTVVHTTGEDRAEARPGAATTMPGAASGEALAAGYRIVEGVRPEAGEHIIYKSAASGFFGTSLASILRRRDIRGLVVCGESTSGCVRATVVDAFSSGFEVVVPQDAVFDRSDISHKINLFDLHLKYATVVSVAQVIGGWRSSTRAVSEGTE